MKINHLFFISLFFATLLLSGQTVDRVEVKGQIITDNPDIEGVTIFNTSSNQGTITDENGKFSIYVVENDRIEVSALQYNDFEITITSEIIKARSMSIFLVTQVNKLDEVFILPYGLTGNLETDLNNTKTINPNLDAVYFGIEEMDQIEFTDDYKSKVNLNGMTPAYLKNGVDFKKIIGTILKPLFKSNGVVDSEVINRDTAISASKSVEFLMKRLKIPQNEIYPLHFPGLT